MQCIKCGEQLGAGDSMCRACYTRVSTGIQKLSADSESGQIAEYYSKKIIPLALSIPFIFGCLLITLANIAGVLYGFSWLGMIDLAFAAVHIIALWLIIFEARGTNKFYYSKTLVALSMFKISAVLSLVLFSISFGLIGLALLFAMLRGIAFLLLIAIVGGIGYVLIRHYFLALFKVLNGIRARITTNQFVPLEGLGSFLFISYILIGLSIAESIVGIFGIGGPLSLGILFTITNGFGMILCLRVLKRIDGYS
ncbi:MAG: hypothetical protein FWE34_02755 [Defluviitaleaceae bacterium]|nr:hypothetical protein [Defluviitaleaceae bacterium]